MQQQATIQVSLNLCGQTTTANSLGIFTYIMFNVV